VCRFGATRRCVYPTFINTGAKNILEEEVRSAGNLGYIGVFIELAGLIMGGIATLVGYIMELVALKRLAESLNRYAIWDNALKAVVVTVVGIITLIVLFLVLLFGPTCYQPLCTYLSRHFFEVLAGFFVLAYVFVLLTGRYYRDAYNELAVATGVKDFNEAAKWTWLGALLFIILIGALLSFVGKVYALMGYNTLKSWKQAQQ
jgi:uncharacterized membrane protein